METFKQFKEAQARQVEIVYSLSRKLSEYPKHYYGMVIESVRMSDEYKALSKDYKQEFKKLQDINKAGVKKYKAELAQERKERYNKLTV